MWCTYTKTFVFRDCLAEEIVDGNVDAINKLLSLKQEDGSCGTFITTDVLSVSVIADSFGAYKSVDDESWTLYFEKGDVEIATISLWHYKEVHLCFEIDEDVRTGEFKIHYCNIKAFKEYQM